MSPVRVLLFSGQFDVICNHLGTEKFLAKLDWAGREVRQFVGSAVLCLTFHMLYSAVLSCVSVLICCTSCVCASPQDWLKATPDVWLVKATAAGLLRKARNLSYLLVRDTGN